jgi:hypothetical protein
MIADVAQLGYLDGRVLDVTYGKGVFWKVWQPDILVGCDLDPTKARDLCCDFCHLPFADGSWDAVVYDPPYQCNGTPGWNGSGVWTRYGVVTMWGNDRANLMERGAREGARVAKNFFLVKCMDQVVGGRLWWQTDQMTQVVTAEGFTKVDRFDFLRPPRPSDGRRQRHARANYSTLLVFQRR